MWWLLLACGRGPESACPEGMVAFPAETVELGEVHPGRPWHLPRREVRLEAWCMDVYEHPNRLGEQPTVNVSWDEAQQLCQAEGKRLCTEAEWARACRGTEGRAYSYGRDYDRARCNTPIQGSGPPNGQDLRQPIGRFPDCASPEGVHDLNGSVSEWVSDVWTGAPEPFNPQGRPDESWHTLRGGTMWDTTFYGQDCSSRHGHPSEGRFGDDGLRCCADAAR